MKYVANLNITEAKYKMEQIIDFNIPKKLKICTEMKMINDSQKQNGLNGGRIL